MSKKVIDKDKLQHKIDILKNTAIKSYDYQYRAGYLRAIQHMNCILNEPDSVIAQLEGDIFITPDWVIPVTERPQYLLLTDKGEKWFDHYEDAINYIREYKIDDNEVISLLASLRIVSSTMNKITSIKEFASDINDEIQLPYTDNIFHEPWLCYEVFLESPNSNREFMGMFSYCKDAIRYLREECEFDDPDSIIKDPNSIIRLVACLHTISTRKHVYTPVKEYVRDIHGDFVVLR